MDVFEALDLTEGEEAVYRALIALGSSTTGPLYKRAKVSQSKVYDILDRLHKKGLASKITHDGIAHWSPASATGYLEKVEEELEHVQARKSVLDEQLPNLLARTQPEESSAQIFVGFTALKTILLDFLDTFADGQSFCVFGTSTPIPEPYYGFIKNYNALSGKRRVKIKLIYGDEMEEWAQGVNEDLPYCEIRIIQGITPTTIIIGPKQILMIAYNMNPVQIISITGEQLASNYQVFFDSIWDMARPL